MIDDLIVKGVVSLPRDFFSFLSSIRPADVYFSIRIRSDNAESRLEAYGKRYVALSMSFLLMVCDPKYKKSQVGLLELFPMNDIQHLKLTRGTPNA